MENYKYIESFNVSPEIGDFIGAYIVTKGEFSFLLNSDFSRIFSVLFFALRTPLLLTNN